MSENNSLGRIVNAGAGTGKTTVLVNDALNMVDAGKYVLITTYTTANTQAAIDKIVKIRGFVPSGLTVRPWYTFLLRDLIRPFHSDWLPQRIGTVNLVNREPVGRRYVKKNSPRFYLDSNNSVYSDRAAQLAYDLNVATGFSAIDRLKRLYDAVYIDEAQDLAGYDFDLIKLLCENHVQLTVVGDPRQKTFSTTRQQKNKQYKTVFEYIENNRLRLDEESNSISYRCAMPILELANRLYPEYPELVSSRQSVSDDLSCCIVPRQDIPHYCKCFHPVQLIWDNRTKALDDFPVMNMGNSKGLEFGNVLVYLTNDMASWLKDKNSTLAEEARAKLYVAITRARNNLGFVLPKKASEKGIALKRYDPCVNNID